MYAISIITYNRRDMLRQVLEAVEATCLEPHAVFVTDNASQDGTADMLRGMEAEGRLKAYCLSENLGTSGGRNAQMADWLGMDSVRLDDKVLPLCPGWLTALSVQSERYHAILTTCYDPTVKHLEALAPCLDFIRWNQEGGQGGPLMFVPGEISKALGGADEYTEGNERCVYGFDDCGYIHRAQLLGWNYGFTFRVPHKILAKASPEGRQRAMRWHPQYMELRRQYEQAERDLFVPLEDTYGYQLWQKVKGQAAARGGNNDAIRI